MLRNALKDQLAGRLEQAEQSYLQILNAGVDPLVLHLLGMICHHTGRHALAVNRLSRAIALQPGVPAFHSDLGAYQQALRLDAACTEAHVNLAVLLLARGERRRALHLAGRRQRHVSRQE